MESRSSAMSQATHSRTIQAGIILINKQGNWLRLTSLKRQIQLRGPLLSFYLFKSEAKTLRKKDEDNYGFSRIDRGVIAWI
jgi:hypothetical protein